MKYCQAVAVMVVLGVAVTVQAEPYKHKASGLQFNLPKGWKCAEKQDGQIIIQNADKTVHLVGGVIDKKTAKEIFDNVDKFLATLEGWKEVKVTDGPKKEKVNDLQQAWFEGTATVKDDGKDLKIEWDLTVVSGGKNPLFLVGMGQLDKNEKVYEKFFESIKKIEDDDE